MTGYDPGREGAKVIDHHKAKGVKERGLSDP